MSIQSTIQSTIQSRTKSQTDRFHYIQERDDEFLALFPHRFDYIWAEHSSCSAAVEWRTESRHPLSDRLIRQGTYLYGVRFGAETNYCLLDIDIGSPYHPRQDPFAISRIAAALEPLGLVSYMACTSSYSGGLHLYFPFLQSQSSWQLAIALSCLLENAGFKLHPGHLEIFPNPKPYTTDGTLSLFNAHRLPLQLGSYLLNDGWQPIWSDAKTFVNQWRFTQQRNEIDSAVLKQILKQVKRKHFGISGKAEKFINDLNTEIELGWTGYGQTNRLLGRITMRAYIFYHVLSGGEPLKGDALVNEIVEVARSLPGYGEWCRHQHEIEQRAQEWARCIENSHYFHFGEQYKQLKPENQDPELAVAIDQSPSWNQRQSAATRDRIRRAIADLLENNNLPMKPTARFQVLLSYGIGGGSLYRHRDLWHPNYFHLNSTETVNPVPETLAENYSFNHLSNHLSNHSTLQSIDIAPTPTPNPCLTIPKEKQSGCSAGASNWLNSTSLLPTSGGDKPASKASGDRTAANSSPGAGNVAISSVASRLPSEPCQGVRVQRVLCQQALCNIQASWEALQEATRLAQAQQQHSKSQAAQQRHIARMQHFLASGDPILMAEALAWTQIGSDCP